MNENNKSTTLQFKVHDQAFAASREGDKVCLELHGRSESGEAKIVMISFDFLTARIIAGAMARLARDLSD